MFWQALNDYALPILAFFGIMAIGYAIGHILGRDDDND
ncbi:MAG: hypothetical protein RL755_59 [Pseudomonadota bacterium]|jgi:hypothetical protein